MSAGADTGILPVTPVEQVVPALLPRHCMIRDLVGGEVVCGRNLARQLVELARLSAVRHAKLAGRMECSERRAVLDGQLIERQMPTSHGERFLKLLPPRLRGLALPRVDQIEAETVEGPARDADGRFGLGNGMQAAQLLQVRVAQGLHS